MSLRTFDPALTWEVLESPIFDTFGNAIEGHKLLTNSKTGKTLQVCKDSYTPTTNGQFLEAVDMLQAYTGFELQGFGTFKGGAKVMAYLKNKDPQSPLGLKLDENLVVGNSHDGSTAFFMGITTDIYRCSNMFTQQNMQYKVYHRSDQERRVKDAVKTVDLYYDQSQDLYTQWEELGSKQAKNEDERRVINALLDIGSPEEERNLSKRKQNIRDRLYTSIAIESRELGNTMFGLFNGVTHYTSNVMKQSNALYGNPFGRAAELNKKALKLCLDIAKERGSKTVIHLPAPAPKPAKQVDYFSI